MNSNQYPHEQGLKPIIEGNFEDPLANDKIVVINIMTPRFLKM